MRHQLRQVQSGLLVDRARVVLDRHDAGARLLEQLRRGRAHVAEALHGHPRAFQRQGDAARRIAPADEHAAPRGLHAPERAAQLQRLARHHARGRGPDVHGVGVHHPGHHLGVGVHVGRRNVLLRADDHANLAGVAARQLLQFFQGQLLRLHPDPALGATERQVHGRVLDAHPRGQRHHLLQRHLRVVAHAALARAARERVLHAVTLEVGDAAVVHFDGHVHDQAALGPAQRLGPARQAAEVGQHAIDLREVGGPGAVRPGVDVGQRGERKGRCGGIWWVAHERVPLQA